MSEKETDYEGKKKLYLDIDRMINEGMAGEQWPMSMI